MIYNWNIVGHEHLLRSLEQDIQNGNLAHAYLFSGPEKVGKYIVAKKLAHILQCPSNFCHECPTCLQIEKGIHPDTIEFLDDGESIKIESIRDVIVHLNMTSANPYKIFLVERIERMTLEAANCLLKTLEEPPPKTLFIFTTASLREVIPTITSRMRVVQFRHCPDNLLHQKIREMYLDIDEETLDHVCRFALGKPGVAFRLMRDPELFSMYRRMYQDLLVFLEGSDLFDRFCYVQEFIEQPEKIDHFLNILTHLVRTHLLNADYTKKRKFFEILESISYARFSLKHHANPKLALERFMLHL